MKSGIPASKKRKKTVTQPTVESDPGSSSESAKPPTAKAASASPSTPVLPSAAAHGQPSVAGLLLPSKKRLSSTAGLPLANTRPASPDVPREEGPRSEKRLLMSVTKNPWPAQYAYESPYIADAAQHTRPGQPQWMPASPYFDEVAETLRQIQQPIDTVPPILAGSVPVKPQPAKQIPKVPYITDAIDLLQQAIQQSRAVAQESLSKTRPFDLDAEKEKLRTLEAELKAASVRYEAAQYRLGGYKYHHSRREQLSKLIKNTNSNTSSPLSPPSDPAIPLSPDTLAAMKAIDEHEKAIGEKLKGVDYEALIRTDREAKEEVDAVQSAVSAQDEKIRRIFRDREEQQALKAKLKAGVQDLNALLRDLGDSLSD